MSEYARNTLTPDSSPRYLWRFISSLSHPLRPLCSLPFLSHVPPSFSLSLPPLPGLSSFYLDLLTRYKQAKELLEMKKVFLLKITPEQGPSSTKMVSNDWCAKRGRNKLTDRNLAQLETLVRPTLFLL